MAYSLEEIKNPNKPRSPSLWGCASRPALSCAVGVTSSTSLKHSPREVRFLHLLLSAPRLDFSCLLLHILSQLPPLCCIISKESCLFFCLDRKLPAQLCTLSRLCSLLWHKTLTSPLFSHSLLQIPSYISLMTWEEEKYWNQLRVLWVLTTLLLYCYRFRLLWFPPLTSYLCTHFSEA